MKAAVHLQRVEHSTVVVWAHPAVWVELVVWPDLAAWAAVWANPVEWVGRRGGAAGPSVPGADVAGIVEKIGSNVTNIAVGDAVFAKLAFGGFRT